MQTEALFENIADRIEQELTQAEQSIYIAVAWFTNPRLFNALLDKAKQGITVQLLISNDPINQQSPIDYSGLNIGNSVAYMIGDGKDDLMHNKFCVIDEYTVINGSYNWSKKPNATTKTSLSPQAIASLPNHLSHNSKNP